VYGIVQQLGRHYRCRQRSRARDAFTIELRRAASIRQTPPEAVSTAEVYEKRSWTILLVDDEDNVRAVMRSVLKQKGYTVLDAATGADAIRLIDHAGSWTCCDGRPHARMSGRELYEQLAGRQPGLKVLYVSGYADGAFGLDPGPEVALLSKPFSLETLAQRVRDRLTSL
jgi:two-component system cell cycle sensor histidine kinase/response regulator CckA